MPGSTVIRNYLLLALGGALGSVARYWLGNLGPVVIQSSFPWGILWVNWIGCFVIGFFAEATGAKGMLNVAPEVRNFVIVGICGGFTTFSSFSLGTLALFKDGAFLPFAYVVSSVIGCLLAVTLGVWLVRFTHLSTEQGEDWEV